MEQARAFLSRAVPWPGPNDDWWINIHAPWRTPGGKNVIPGRAFKTLDQAVNHIEWKLKNSQADLYVCMSGQRMANQKKDRVWQAVRRNENAVCLRSLWLDVDVKVKGFPSTEAALKAFGEFRRAASLPMPTYLVMTGSGGFHVHWVLEDAVPPSVWDPLAHALVAATKALKFEPLDTGVAINNACLLRVPDTLNFKHTPPMPVWLAHKDNLYSLPSIERALGPYINYAKIIQPRAGAGLGKSLGPKSALFARSKVKADALDAGLDVPPPPTIDDVAVQCPFIDDTLNSGGQGLTEPVWRESLKVAYYCDDGLKAAHDLSDGHGGYDALATDEKYYRVVADQRQGAYGWPQCDTIWKAGATQCPACPHHRQGKSPLNFVALLQAAPPAPPPPPAPPSFTGGGKPNPFPTGFGYLPHPYYHDPSGYPLMDVADEDDPTKVTAVRVCSAAIHYLWGQAPNEDTGNYAINFSTPVNNKTVSDIQLEYEDLGDYRKLNLKLAKKGVVMSDINIKGFRGVMSSFVEELMAKKHAAVLAENYGWSVESGKPTAFVYGKVRWNCVGNTRVAPTDTHIAILYEPCGDLEVWKKAAKLITDQHRPALDAIIAASFGAPLVNLTGHNGLVLAAYSPESGVGKSTAMQVAQSVWGNPVGAMASLDDTANFVNARLGVLRHLPLLYDELKLEEQTQKFVTMVFGMGQGKTKGRLNRNSVSQQISTFSTLMVAASNNSLGEYIVDHTKLTTAGLYRVFEFRVEKNLTGDGMINGGAAQTLLGSLRGNYGKAGLIYAEFLGQNAKAVAEQVGKTSELIFNMLGAATDERFWVATLTVVLLGAKFSNKLGLTTIDIPALSGFLVGEFHKLRTKGGRSTTDITKSGTLTDYVSDYVNTRRQQTVITDTIWRQPSRPPALYKVILKQTSSPLQGRLSVHAAEKDLLLRISLSDFRMWLKEKRGVQPSVLVDQILKTLPAKIVQSCIALHVQQYQVPREPLIEFDLSKMPDFYDFN